jgi:hypothetical protein
MIEKHTPCCINRASTRLKAMLESGEIGSAESAHGTFYLDNRNPANIRNAYVEGGGGLWDIGCVSNRGRALDVRPRTLCGGLLCREGSPFRGRPPCHRHPQVPLGGAMSFACGMRFPAETHMTFTHQHTQDRGGRDLFQRTETPEHLRDLRRQDKEARTYSFEPVDQYALECKISRWRCKRDDPLRFAEHTFGPDQGFTALFESARIGHGSGVAACTSYVLISMGVSYLKSDQFLRKIPTSSNCAYHSRSFPITMS